MTTLFQRAFKLSVGNLDLSKLRCKFRVKSTLKAEPNTADVDVYNLGNFHRQQLEQAKTAVMKLEVGYKTGTHQIFLGQVRTCFTEVDGPDRVTKLSSGDGEQAVQGVRVALTYGSQVQIDVVLQDLANAMGISPGNIAQAAAKVKARGSASIYPQGVSLCGNAWRELVTVCRSAGLEVTIQDGALLLTELGQALRENAVRLAPGAGLVGSPSADSDGTVDTTALLIPELRPGVKVLLDSLSTGKGLYRIRDAEYTGDTHGQEWYANLGLQKIPPNQIQIQELVI